MSMMQQHAHCAFKNIERRRRKSLVHSLSTSDSLRTGRASGFLKSFLRIMLSLSLSQSNEQTVPQFGCSTGKCSDSKVFLLLCLGRHWGCEDEIGWRTADDALECSEVLVPEGSGGLCQSCSCTQETGFCSQCAFQQVVSTAHGERV